MATYLLENKETWATRTHNRKLACFRAFGKFHGWPDFLASYKRPPNPPGVAHPIAEGIEGVLEMIGAARSDHHRALVVLTGLCGLRVGEAIRVKPDHIDVEEMLLTVHKGKGQKTRIVPLSDTALLHMLPRLVACWASGDVLVPIHERKAYDAIDRIGKRALNHRVATHDMRMTAGTAFYEESYDIRATQELLGHASIETTQSYTKVSLKRMREAVEIA